VIVLSLNIGSKLGTGAEAIVDMIGAGVRFYCCDYVLEHVVVVEKQVSPCASVSVLPSNASWTTELLSLTADRSLHRTVA
jgi:hypothetical protein